MIIKDLVVGKKIYYVNYLTGQIQLGEITYANVTPSYADRYRACLGFKYFGKTGKATTKYMTFFGNAQTFHSPYVYATLKEAQECQKSVKKILGDRYTSDIKKFNQKIRRTKEKIMSLNTMPVDPIWTPTVNKVVKAQKG